MVSINFPLIVLLVLVSLSVTSVYSRDAVSKQDDESYFMATSDQGPSMIDVEDLAKARSLQALVAGSKVVVSRKSRRSSTKSSEKKGEYKTSKRTEVLVLVLLIVMSILITLAIIRHIYLCYERITKKANGHEKMEGSSETHTSKTQDYV